jgi:hypothetical protein
MMSYHLQVYIDKHMYLSGRKKPALVVVLKQNSA